MKRIFGGVAAVVVIYRVAVLVLWLLSLNGGAERVLGGSAHRKAGPASVSRSAGGVTVGPGDGPARGRGVCASPSNAGAYVGSAICV